MVETLPIIYVEKTKFSNSFAKEYVVWVSQIVKAFLEAMHN